MKYLHHEVFPALCGAGLWLLSMRGEAQMPAPPANPAPPAPTAPAEPGAEAKPALKPDDLPALKAAVGTQVTIEGTPVRVGETKSKTVRFLDFSPQMGQAISLVVFASKSEAMTLEQLQEFVGKKLRVTGTVTEFSGRLQLKIEDKGQLEVLP